MCNVLYQVKESRQKRLNTTLFIYVAFSKGETIRIKLNQWMLGTENEVEGVDYCVNCLLLCNILVASLRVSVDQRLGLSLQDRFWLKIFHEVVDKQVSCLRTAMLSEGSTRGVSASKLIYVVVGRIQFLVECGLGSLVPCFLVSLRHS